MLLVGIVGAGTESSSVHRINDTLLLQACSPKCYFPLRSCEQRLVWELCSLGWCLVYVARNHHLACSSVRFMIHALQVFQFVVVFVFNVVIGAASSGKAEPGNDDLPIVTLFRALSKDPKLITTWLGTAVPQQASFFLMCAPAFHLLVFESSTLYICLHVPGCWSVSVSAPLPGDNCVTVQVPLHQGYFS